MKTHLLLVFALVGCAPLKMAGPELSPERRHAIDAPIEQLRREAFGGVADVFVEVQRPTWTGLSGPSSPPTGLLFATRADSAGNPGLCKATIAWVSLKPQQADNPLETRKVYKVVGALKPLPDMWNEAYGAQLSAKCQRAGRVITSDSSDFGQIGFFSISPDDDGNLAWLGARSLEIAKEEVSASRLQVSCKLQPGIVEDEKDSTEPRPTVDQTSSRDCDTPRDVMKSLNLARLMSVEVKPCEQGAKLSCVTGTVLRSANFNEQHVWEVRLTAHWGKVDNRNVVDVASVTLQSGRIIID